MEMSQDKKNEIKSNQMNLEQQAKGLAVTAPSRDLGKLVEAMKPQIAKVLPKHITADRMTRVALTCLRQIPKLAMCSPESFLGALLNASQVGLEPGGALGLSYLIPYENKRNGTVECQFQIGVKGLRELAYRSGKVAFMGAYVIRAKDTFELSYGSYGKFTYQPNLTADVNAKDNQPILYVSYLKYKDGSESYLHMVPSEVFRVRDRYSKAAKFGGSPWETEPEAMALKTVVKKHLKNEQLSIEQQEALDTDEAIVRAKIETPVDLLPASQSAAMAEFLDVMPTNTELDAELAGLDKK